MPLIIRLGDTSSHGGAVVSSAAHWRCEGQLIARKGDLFACPIPGHGINPIVEGLAAHRCESSGLPATATERPAALH